MHTLAMRLRSATIPKKKAKKLVEILDLMGLPIKLSQAQEATARLMGYDNWAELNAIICDDPEAGPADAALTRADLAARRGLQCAVLEEVTGLPASSVDRILEVLDPTGPSSALYQRDLLASGFVLFDEDREWVEAGMDIARRYDGEVRPLYRLARRLAPPGERGLTHIRFERLIEGARRHRPLANTSGDEVASHILSLIEQDDVSIAEDVRNEIRARSAAACALFDEMHKRIVAHGPAPMLAPVYWTFMMHHSTYVSGDRDYYEPLCPEPVLHIGYDLPRFRWSPENEWPVSRALHLQAALRREFLEAGWTGEGPDWTVEFREGNGSKEEMTVAAPTAADAVAYAAAARGALRIAKGQRPGRFYLTALDGPSDAADGASLVEAARSVPIIQRGRLSAPDALRVRGQQPVDRG